MASTIRAIDRAAKNVNAMREALDHHNASCGFRAEAFLLHPYDHGLLRLELWGVPVSADDAIRTKHFRLHCSSPEDDDEGVLPADEE